MAAEPDSRLQEASDAVNMTSLDGSGRDSADGTSEPIPAAPVTPIAANPSTDPEPSTPESIANGAATLSTPESAANEASESSQKIDKGKGVAHGVSSDDKDDKDNRKDSLSIEPTDSLQKPSNTTCMITLLLPTNARHPYKIDEKYLTKRSITTPELTEDGKPNPFSISVYTLKELILREWRTEWDARPASPSSIRLIFFGKLLEDKTSLCEYNFSRDSPNIVHMAIRPPEVEEDEISKGTKNTPSSREGNSCGCCVVS